MPGTHAPLFFLGTLVVKMADKIEAFKRLNVRLGKWLNAVAMAFLGVLICMTVADIFAIRVVSKPITGSPDIIGLIGLLITAFAYAQTQLLGRHIRVDFFLTRMPRATQKVLDIIADIMNVGFVGTVIAVMVRYGFQLIARGGGSPTLKIPLYPFTFAISLALIPVFLIHLTELTNAIARRTQK